MENKGILRREFSKGLLVFLALADPSTRAIYGLFSETPSYESARNNPILQEKWVRDILRRYGVDKFFGDVIIITPENAHRYTNEYDRNKMVSSQDAKVRTFSTGKIEDFGTSKWSMPKLYVPTEAFKGSEGDLTALIVYHESNHAKVPRNGFGFVTLDDFVSKEDTRKYNYGMLITVDELEAHKEQIEKGVNIMSRKGLESTYGDYMSHYIQLWRYGEEIKDAVTEMLKVRYLQPWMRNAKSLWVYEKGPLRLIEYGGREEFPFIVAENVGNMQQFYIQFKFVSRTGVQVIKLPLPPKIALSK